MECISELKENFNAYFAWNKARMACFVNMLFALLAFVWGTLCLYSSHFVNQRRKLTPCLFIL